jgi:hypothetical protein
MTPKSFLTLAAVTAVSVIAAAWSVTASGPAAPPEREGERFLPDLAAEANEVARITVTGEGGTYAVERTPEGWVLPDKGGFPVRIEAVRELVGGLARLTVVEAKTDRIDRLARLGLQNPAEPGAGHASRGVRLETADGTVVADLVLGRSDYRLGGEGGLYVREAGASRSWLVQGRAPVPADAVSWTERRLADLPAEEAARVTLHRDGAPALTVERGTDGKARLADGTSADQQAADRLFGLFANLRFDDVRPVQDLPDARVRRAELTGMNGLLLRLSTVEVEGEEWALIEVEATAQEAREAAEAIAGRVDGFAFRLPDHRMALLKTTAETLTAPSS